VPLTPLITQLITSIDGAVLLDPEGYCYSIGVILDGKASGHGNGTRGARYNSAVRYVESSPYPCLVVVVSEDGMVDVLTKENLAESRQ
jgi:DNA integrity scanning protein DisA with diadenylate cyclase activity